MTFQEIIPVLTDGRSVRREAWREDVYIRFTQHKDPFYKYPVLGLFSDEQPDEYCDYSLNL